MIFTTDGMEIRKKIVKVSFNCVLRIKTYEHENEWEKAVSSYDVLLSQPSTADVQTGLMQVIQALVCSVTYTR